MVARKIFNIPTSLPKGISYTFYLIRFRNGEYIKRSAPIAQKL